MKSLLLDARAGRYALPAFNAINIETAQVIVKAAELEQSAVIVQISENAARYAGLYVLTAAAQALQARASVPIMLHFDHAETLASAVTALELGFNSVMLEGADLNPDENVALLGELSKIAHRSGAVVEGEFEIVEKDGRTGTHLAVDNLARLSYESGCDSVAVDIGSAHKMINKTAKLDLDRLREIAAVISKPLVLHGASGVPETDLVHSTRLGISKVNIATELMQSFTRGVRRGLTDSSVTDPRKYLAQGQAEMLGTAQRLIRLLK